MATYLIVVKGPDDLDPERLVSDIVEGYYHVPAIVTGRRFDPDAIRQALADAIAGRIPDPVLDGNLAEAVDEMLAATTGAVTTYLEA